MGCLACGSKKVPAEDARQLVKDLEAISSVEGADTQARLLYGGCAELASCAAGCEKALAFAAKPALDAAQRGVILAECFSELKKEHAQNGISADAWFQRYMSSYAERARAELSSEDQKRLAAAKGKIGLP